MKKSLIVILILGTILLLGGCFGTSKVEVRINNKSTRNLVNVRIGSTEYGNISSGVTTSYQEVKVGSSDIKSDESSDGSYLTGTCNVTAGTGTKRYTLSVDSKGVTSTED